MYVGPHPWVRQFAMDDHTYLEDFRGLFRGKQLRYDKSGEFIPDDPAQHVFIHRIHHFARNMHNNIFSVMHFGV